MDSFLKSYIDRNDEKDEFEVRFGDSTKMNYNNVIQWLLRSGFHIVDPNGKDLLRITVDKVKSRVELSGFDAVQSLCKDNTLTRPLYTTKTTVSNFDGKKKDYNIRMSLSQETPATLDVIDEITRSWLSSTKTFRYMNRIQLRKEDCPFAIDCSIVRMVRNQKNASMLFSSEMTYEIEAEFINDYRKEYTNVPKLQASIAKAVTYVLRGFQRTYYPVPYPILEGIKEEYMELSNTKSNPPERNKFIGPNLVTLQLNNIYKTEDPTHESIQTNFTVTDKADGERKLLMVNKEGRVYLITSNLSVEYTGFTTTLKSVLIDGEHIEYDKDGNYINTFMCFDLYLYQHKKKPVDVRDKSLVDVRLPTLSAIVNKLNETEHIDSKLPECFKINAKTFYYQKEGDKRSIFDYCKLLLQQEFIYKTDGLIFTPAHYGVGLTKQDSVVKNYRDVWDLNFKWKPAEDNTIDFYIRLKDYIPGTTHRTMWLYVGYSKRDLLASPSFSIFHANELVPPKENKIIFQTTEPYDEKSYICNMNTDTGILRTEHGEIIEDEMVIECRYDVHAKHGWNWVPLRVRWDKMKTVVDSQGKNITIRTPNAYTTAVNNWYTIHHPITPIMITTGHYDNGSPIMDNTYYNEYKTTWMNELRKFHNQIKSKLIDIHVKGRAVPVNRTLLDLACGKGGDLQKWKASKFSFVLGIDITLDNLMNRKNGACVRYLSEFPKGFKTQCLFLQGDSSKNVRNGDCYFTPVEKEISDVVFGNSVSTTLGKGVKNHAKKGRHGFDIVSIQFAVHYMFGSKESLHGHLRNIAECTKLHGYYIGTCYDGQRVLDKIQDGEYRSEDESGNLICSIKKSKTEHRTALTMEDCLGFTIEVNQSTIGKYIDEYLVYFPYFIREMKKYGFEVVGDELEGFTSGIESFERLYTESMGMNLAQKHISYLNNYFIFKKVREVPLFVEKLGRITI
jgi:hypothetical protein